MFKHIIAVCLLLSCSQLKVVAEDKTELLIGEVKAQLGQKSSIIYYPEMAKFTVNAADRVCHYYSLYEQAYSNINKSVDKQKVKAEILIQIGEGLKQDNNYEYINNWTLEYYEAVIDAALISNYCY